MKIYPAIDLREGATVQLVGGDPDREEVHNPEPLHVAAKWVDEGASALHVVDLDAALGRGTNLYVVQRILSEILAPVQLGGGVRHLVDIQARLDMGVGRVIVGTQGIREPLWFETAAELFPGKLILAVDARGDEVAVSGWQEGSGVKLEEILRRVEDLPLAGLLYTNVDIEGGMGGVDRAAVEKVRRGTEHSLTASGGIGSMEDLDSLKELGVDGAVLGMSIYTGRIELKSAIERIEGRKVQTGRAVLIPKPTIQWGGIPEGTPEDRVIRAPGDYDEDLDEDQDELGPGRHPDLDVPRPRTLWGRKRDGEEEEEEDWS